MGSLGLQPSKGLSVEVGSMGEPASTTIQQISPEPKGLFPLLLGAAYLHMFSGGFGGGACCLLCLKRDSGGKGQWGSVRENVPTDERVSPELVWWGEELVRL